jgi:CPA2 family monovalent cation:H+ antiporter-2
VSDTVPAPSRRAHEADGDVPKRHVIIVGFGLSGRSTVNTVINAEVSYAVIETNQETVSRCTKGGLNIIFGDARDSAILKRAGIDHATDVMVTIPNDELTGAVVEQARRLNPAVHIVARCTFVSGGMDAHKRGADETVIGEQVVANEFARVTAAALARDLPR